MDIWFCEANDTVMLHVNVTAWKGPGLAQRLWDTLCAAGYEMKSTRP